MTLKKRDIIDNILMEIPMPRREAQDIVESIIEIIKDKLALGEEVLVSGFGKFCVQEKKERMGRNPATDSEMILPKRKIVTFKCSKILKNRMNE